MIFWVVEVIGTARPSPTPARAVLIPTTCAELSASAPPELPGLRAASVWMMSSITRILSPARVGSERPTALTTPAVTLPANPRGLPIATTIWPTRSRSASPSWAGARSPRSACSTARSDIGSRPRTANGISRPSAIVSSPADPWATTCAEVTRYPSAERATADPLPAGRGRPSRPRPVTVTAATDGETRSATETSVSEYASSSRRSGAGSGAGDIRTLTAHLLHTRQGLPQAGDPVGLVLRHEPHAPRERLTPAARHPRVDQSVEHPPVLETEAGHDRDAEGGEQFLLATAPRPPGDLAPEDALRLVGDANASVARLVAEARNPSRAGRGAHALGSIGGDLGLVDVTDDQDLVTIGGDRRGAGEELVGQAAGEPAGDFVFG